MLVIGRSNKNFIPKAWCPVGNVPYTLHNEHGWIRLILITIDKKNLELLNPSPNNIRNRFCII